MIRFIVGFLIVFGSVGGLDANPDASIMTLLSVAIVGLLIMASGANSLGEKYE
jgi:hypothetical protein